MVIKNPQKDIMDVAKLVTAGANYNIDDKYHHVFRVDQRRVVSEEFIRGPSNPQVAFTGTAASWDRDTKRDWFWKIFRSGRSCELSSVLIWTLGDLADKNVSLVYENKKVVNIFKARAYIPLVGLDSQFSICFSKSDNPKNLYPVYSYFQAENKNDPHNIADKELNDKLIQAITAALDVDLDEVALHYWVCVTLEDHTMVHIDLAGPVHECYEYIKYKKKEYPLSVRLTPELHVCVPAPDLQPYFPSMIVMDIVNQETDELMKITPWRIFSSYRVYPSEVFFLRKFGTHTDVGEPFGSMITGFVETLIRSLLQKNKDLLTYNLTTKPHLNNQRVSVVKPSNKLGERLEVFLPHEGRSISVLIKNVRFLPELPEKQYLRRDEMNKRLGISPKVQKQKSCKCEKCKDKKVMMYVDVVMAECNGPFYHFEFC